MRFAIIIFCALILLLLAGVLPVGKGMSAHAVYYSPLMILLLAVLSVLSLMCCLKRRPVGFLLVHLGVVIILGGALTGYIVGMKGSLHLSLNPSRPERRLMTSDGSYADLGFSVAAENFEIRFYPPVYTRFRPFAGSEVQPGKMPFDRVGELDAGDVESWRIDGRSFAVSNLRTDSGWVERYRMENGSVLVRQPQTPSFYGVTLLIGDQEIPISINHPADYRGWRFYLVSYDQRARRTVQLSARRDPGRGAVIVGIWAVMAGTFLLCFRKERGECQVASDEEGA